MKNCIACGSVISYSLFNPSPQPLSALNLPKTSTEAVDAIRYPMNFRMCAICGHVWNIEFDYTKVPYVEDSNLMYNSGGPWQQHLNNVSTSLDTYIYSWSNQIAIDIGCGDGQFFNILQTKHQEAKFIGFEPGVDAQNIQWFQVVQDYFVPERDLKKYRPTILVCRHVIEHLENPREFVAEIAYWALRYELQPLCLFEVPRFDKALRLGRIGDFLYEHVSNFTKKSFQTMFQISSYYEHFIYSLYNDEVLVGIVQPQNNGIQTARILQQQFRSECQVSTVKEALEQLCVSGGKVVLWGGTGKSAAFLNLYGLTSDRFPLVVDSDIHKVGRFVPGTGQKILSVKDLDNPDAIFITTSWRIIDICKEITSLGITCPVYGLKNGNFQRVQ